ncbi:NEL-type E3 ubiquitin ligase domain-containing protein [Pseudomonas guariconensis]|uniref:NEL-type E3 ubiquitin ligase domain-containing protein n=1 Tax=Pseudomonas guariconensis TaxID=1288410 RepID=UPI002B05BE25|nr:NEL-type E3 ubiquitin ligase domain-containing protein [Pseudomonas guariconensis]
MSDPVLPEGSIDTLFAQRMPDWLIREEGGPQRIDRLRAFRKALSRQENAVAALRPVLAQIPSIEAFAEPLLREKLIQLGEADADLRRSQVCIWRRPPIPSFALMLSLRQFVPSSTQSLLASALHNFHLSETRPVDVRRGYLRTSAGKRMALGFHAFAGRCRELDIGAKYQEKLQAILRPKGGAQAVHRLFQENQQAHLEVAVRRAQLKGELDEDSFQHMLALMMFPSVVPATSSIVVLRHLYLLGVPIHGVVCAEASAPGGGALHSVIVWVPNDPDCPIKRFDSWQQVYDGLARRLANRRYRQFFARFVSEADRVKFFSSLAEQSKDWTHERLATLTGGHEPIEVLPEKTIGERLSTFLADSQIDKIFNDAAVLAVPTGKEDENDRSARLRGYESLGLNVLNIAALFVPVLGEALLPVALVQIADEFYEGYEEWRLGDRQGAIDHVFGVAENLVAGALLVKGGAVAVRALKRVAFVDELSLIRTRQDQVKLFDGTLEGYRLDPSSTAVQTPQELRLLHGDDQLYRLSGERDGHIRHPTRANVYTPVIEDNGAGGWRHEFERPQTWSGAGTLLRRLSGRLADLSDETARHLLQSTGYSEAQVRQLHLQNLGAPARLLDALEYHQLHRQHPHLGGTALEALFKERQPWPGPTEGKVLRDFPGLSLRCAREICTQATGAEITRLQTSDRLPLALAERARWYLRESRLDRACAGLRLFRATNVDTERLALGLIDTLAPWAADLRIEIREGTLEGPLQAKQGKAQAARLRRIIRSGSRYTLEGQGSEQDLMSSLFSLLSDTQKRTLGVAGQQVGALEDHLAAYASKERGRVATLLGLSDAKTLRPPVRFGDGQAGYLLSGRGAFDSQAIVRGIHRIFPTLSSFELDAYIRELTTRRVGLYEHFSMLSRDLEQLRTTLDAWRSDTSGLFTRLRRRRVADQIRRSWRRKIVDEDGVYILAIDSEPVGSLPTLPQGVRFDHVRRLVLRNMDLTDIDADFLRRFANLRELDLMGNRLERIPPGLEHLGQLRLLDLSRNRIVLDESGEGYLRGLTQLQHLNLSHNSELGRVPELSHLPNLREMRLRAAGLVTLPERLPFAALVDLRSNRIEMLQRDNHLLRHRLERVLLHDNPSSRGGSEGSASSGDVSVAPVRALEGGDTQENLGFQHARVDASLRARWLEEGADEPDRQALWDTLQEEPGSASLFQFLADFASSRDFKRNPQRFRARIWSLLQACAERESLRQRLFTIMDGPRGCDDRLLLTLRHLEVSVLAEQAILGVPKDQVESTLLGLARPLFRFDEIERIAKEHIARLEAEREAQMVLGLETEAVDPVETELAYQVALYEWIGLPLQKDWMHFGRFSRLTKHDVEIAQAQVLSLENDEALIGSLAQRTFWVDYVKARYAQRFDEVHQTSWSQLDALDEHLAAGQILEGEYARRAKEMVEVFNQAERELVKTLAREAYMRAKP